MLRSSLVIHSREAGDEKNLQQRQVASLEGKMKLASDLEGQLTDTRAREQQVADELKKITEGRDVTVVRLEKQLALAKKTSIKEFRFFNDFQGSVELITSKYFDEGFDFLKM